MNDKKEIIYGLTLQISKITLRVRFPCTVCTAIKIDGNQREIAGEAELRNGQALLNILHHTQIPLPAKKEQFTLDKKCTLLIYLKSSSGRIPAGSVPLPLMKAEARTIREISRIDKCPDKNAFIEFEMKLEKMEEKKDATLASTLEKEYRPLNNEYSQKIIKLTKTQSPQKNLQDKNKSLRHLVGSQIEQKSVKDTILLRRMASKREEIQRSSLFQTYYSGQRKVNDGEKIFALQREMDSYKTKLMILESEIANKNQRYSQNEKEMKQLQKKNQQLDMELKSTISKMDYADRVNKDLTNQIKQLKEKSEQQKLNHQNAIKRLQIRQNSCKQQIKTISDKLYGSQSQKQRMVYQKNLSSNEFQGRQKKLRESFKEKEKKMLEERTIQLKKIDSLEKDIQKLKDEIGQSKSKNIDNIQQVHELKIIVENVQSEKQRFRNQCNDLRFELTKLKNEKHILQENLDSIGKFNEERRNFRKHLSDRDIEISQLKDKVISTESQISRLRNQNEQLDKTFKQKCNFLKTLERDYNIILKENAILVGDLSNKQSKVTSLIEQLQMQMKRSKYLQGSAAQLQQQFQSKQDALERQLRQSSSYRNILQQEVDKLNQQLENAHQQISSNLKEIQQLQQMLQQKNEWIASLQSQMIQLNTLNQQWQMEKIELAQEKRQIQEKYQQFSQESQEHQKQLNGRILTISQKWEENATQLEHSLAENNEKLKLLKDMLKEKEDHLASMTKSNEQLQKQIDMSVKQRQIYITQQTDFNNTISNLKDSCANLKKQVSDRDAIIESLRNSVESIEKYSNETENKNENLASDLKIMQNSNKRLKEQFDSYKQANYIALEIINSNLKSVSLQIDAIDYDQKCNEKINSILKSLVQRNKDIQKQLGQKYDKIAQLQNKLQCLIEERDIKEQGLLAAGQHLELLKKNTNQYSDEITNKNAIIRQINEQLKLKEKEIQDIEVANSKKIFGLNTIISQKNREQVELKHFTDQLSESLQKLTLQLKNANIELKKIQKQKKTIQYDQKSKLSMVDTNLRTQMQRVNTLEADKSFLQKQLRQERDNLRKVMRQLQNKCYQFQDLQLRLEQHNSIGSFKQSELKRLKQTNSELKFLFDLLFSIDLTSFDRKNILNDRVEKYLNETASKQNEIFKQKMRSYYENLSSFMGKHLDLLETFGDLSAQYQSFKVEADRQQVAQNKVLTELQLKLQDIGKIREKESQSKNDILKSYDEQKVSADALRRFVEELIKLLNTMQKEKKVSAFVISPVKELIKKIEEYCLQINKNITTCINKNKREWDLANIRAKKNNSKKEETVSPNIRP